VEEVDISVHIGWGGKVGETALKAMGHEINSNIWTRMNSFKYKIRPPKR
jgi:hypothetical protein